MLKKIKKYLKKLLKKKKIKIKNKKKIETRVVEKDIVEVRIIIDEVLNELEFSSLEDEYELSSTYSLSFFSVDEMENDLKIMIYNQLIDSIELP